MNKGTIVILVVIALLIIAWFAWGFYTTHNIEEPKYSVVEERDGYEIREYESYIVAEVEVEGSYNEATNQGFFILADYIFGNNKPKDKVAMTAPVLEEEKEKIAMTTPVTVEKTEKIAMTAPVNSELTENETRIITFMMPSEYTLETLPEANNDRINFKEVPAKKMAVLDFSRWYATADRVETKKKELLELLKRDKVVTIGNLQVARYNDPFTIPIMMRNEILVEIE